ncbi:MAG: hypothetical protein DMF94_33050 [Acidobacteria bacterium]|nr:MAG: hypothetical protein DMF96_13090 [Acidobacteriota bacterium]PYR15054.1 MAG: hypothetical protein DMF94_33050 [Acidobacteriota bacterium]
MSIDVSGLARLVGPARAIGEELGREAAARGVRAHVAVAGTRMAALVLALARPGLTVIPRGEEAAALAMIPIGILEKIHDDDRARSSHPSTGSGRALMVSVSNHAVFAFKRWGLKTLGELAALPAADLVSRLGRPATMWQAIARGEDIRPLVPTLAEERFESSLELEWPIEDLEPLSFVLTRLLEPLATRLERRDRGAAVLHVLLGLVTHPSTRSGRGEAVEPRETCVRRLELPSPVRDVRTLRTLALLDLESHPPAAAVECVTIVIDPTPGRVLQHRLFTRAHPTPEQLSTLVARLGALMGSDRFGAPATVDSFRPGAFAMTPFATDHDKTGERKACELMVRQAHHERRGQQAHHERPLILSLSKDEPFAVKRGEPPVPSPQPRLVSALRRCRQPVPARVAVADGRPVRVTTDRRGFTGGTVVRSAGPWRTSGNWWSGGSDRSSGSGRLGESGGSGESGRRSGSTGESGGESSVSSTHQAHLTHATHLTSWDRDEWDVALGDGAVYRIFYERDTDRWFIDAIVD